MVRQVAAEAVGAEHLPNTLGGPLRVEGAAFEPGLSPLTLHRPIPDELRDRETSLPRSQLTIHGPLTVTSLLPRPGAGL